MIEYVSNIKTKGEGGAALINKPVNKTKKKTSEQRIKDKLNNMERNIFQ